MMCIYELWLGRELLRYITVVVQIKWTIDPEVLTDLNCLGLSTLPFELHPTDGIKIDYKGDVLKHLSDLHLAGIPMQCARIQPFYKTSNK